MTRKDYVAIARAINVAAAACVKAGSGYTTQTQNVAASGACRITAEAIAEHCASDNPRFDRVRFLKACGVQS